MVQINYVNWGLANRFDDCIEMNIHLKKNQRLHDSILDHEMGHKKHNTFKQDLIHDLTPVNKLSQKDVLIFMIKHPKTFTQLLPFYYSPSRKEIIYDISMLIIYSFAGTLIGLAFWLL